MEKWGLLYGMAEGWILPFYHWVILGKEREKERNKQTWWKLKGSALHSPEDVFFVSVLGMIIICSLILGCNSMVCTIIVLRVHHKSATTSVPKWINYVVLKGLGTFIGWRSRIDMVRTNMIIILSRATSHGAPMYGGVRTWDVRHEKTDLKVFVVVIPKEGWARVAAPILLLVWHRLLENMIYEVKRLKF